MLHTPGTFDKMRAVCTFHFGKYQFDIMKDSIVEFDGQTIKIGGTSYDGSQLNAVEKAGWLVPEADTTSRYIAKPSGITVRPATSMGQERGAPMTIQTSSDEETIVSTLDDSNARRMASGSPGDNARPTPRVAGTMNVDGVIMNRPTPPKFQTVSGDGDVVRTVKSASAPVPVASGADGGERMAVKTLKSAVTRTVLKDSSVVDDEVRRLDNVSGQQVGAKPVPQRVREPVKIEEIDPGTPIRQLGSPVKRTVLDGSLGVEREIRALDNVGGAQVKAAAKPAIDIGHGADTLEELMADDPEFDVVASSTLPGEFKWDTDQHWRVRVKTAVDKYANDAVKMSHILSVEKPEVVEHIKTALAKAAAPKPTAPQRVTTGQ